MEILADHPEVGGDGARKDGAFRPLVKVALVVLSVARGQVQTLLRPEPSEATEWSLPLGAPSLRASLEEAARVEMSAVGAPAACHLEQLYTWGDPNGASGDRVLQVGYLALMPSADRPPSRSGPQWFPLSELPPLPAGHAEFLEAALQRLRRQLTYTNVAWSLLPDEFSLSDLQSVYEAAEGRAMDKRNFRKWVLTNNLVEATENERRDGAHRPARLYQFPSRELRVLA